MPLCDSPKTVYCTVVNESSRNNYKLFQQLSFMNLNEVYYDVVFLDEQPSTSTKKSKKKKKESRVTLKDMDRKVITEREGYAREFNFSKLDNKS